MWSSVQLTLVFPVAPKNALKNCTNVRGGNCDKWTKTAAVFINFDAAMPGNVFISCVCECQNGKMWPPAVARPTKTAVMIILPSIGGQILPTRCVKTAQEAVRKLYRCVVQ